MFPYQQPISHNMTFPLSYIFSRKFMWSIFRRQLSCFFKQFNNLFKPFHWKSTFYTTLNILLKTFSSNNSIFHIPNFSNISSASLYSVTLPWRISSIASSMPDFLFLCVGKITTPFMDFNTFISPDITLRSSTCIVIVFIITSFLLKCNLAYLQSYIFFPNTQSISLRNHTLAHTTLLRLLH